MAPKLSLVAFLITALSPCANAGQAEKALKSLGVSQSELEAQTIQSTVRRCVGLVQSQAKTVPSFEAEFYKRFDAYYNSATETVLNNVTMQGERKPLFVFQKCMAESGYPLK